MIVIFNCLQKFQPFKIQAYFGAFVFCIGFRIFYNSFIIFVGHSKIQVYSSYILQSAFKIQKPKMDNRKRVKYDFDYDGMSMETTNQIPSIDSLPYQIAQLHLGDDYKKQQVSKHYFYYNYNKLKENQPPLHSPPFYHHRHQYNQDQNQNQNQKVMKWWTPRNDEQLKLFKKAKSDVLCFLSVNKDGIKVGEVFEIMSKQTQAEIDFVKIGFSSFSELLFHFDDILMVKTNGKDDFIFLKKGLEAPELSHIRTLVQKTPNGRTNYREFKATILNTVQAPLENLLKISNMKISLISAQISHGQKRKRPSRGVFTYN